MNKELSKELVRLNVRVRPEMHRWLKEQGEARGLTLNAMVIFAIETYAQQQMMVPMMPDILKHLEEEKQKSSQSKN